MECACASHGVLERFGDLFALKTVRSAHSNSDYTKPIQPSCKCVFVRIALALCCRAMPGKKFIFSTGVGIGSTASLSRLAHVCMGRYYTLHYYLADDTAEILENMSRTGSIHNLACLVGTPGEILTQPFGDGRLS